jgi:hypothetical protein
MKHERLEIRMDEAELLAARLAAEAEGLDLSSWARRALVQQAIAERVQRKIARDRAACEEMARQVGAVVCPDSPSTGAQNPEELQE